MVRGFLVVYAAVCALVGTASAHTYYFSGSGAGLVAFIDGDTIQSNGSNRTVWSLWVYTPPKKEADGTIQYAMDEDVYNCVGHTNVGLYTAGYTVTGASVSGGQLTPTSAPVVPDSLGEAVMNQACNGIPKTSPPFTDVHQAIGYANSIHGTGLAPQKNK